MNGLLRLRETSPPVGDPRFRLIAFELAFTVQQKIFVSEKFRQKRPSGLQFVRNLFLANVGSLVLSSVVRFACLSFIFTFMTISDPTLVVFVDPTLVVLWKI